MNRKIIIFTDLDGTLLHPRDYSFDDAIPALGLIREMEIPLVLSSSKTRAEIELCRKRLSNVHPFVSENGGGVFIPEGYFQFPIVGEVKDRYRVINFGSPYTLVRKILSEIETELKVKIRGFGDMTVNEVAEITGMSIEEASLAKEREFDEPFLFEETEEWARKKSLELIEKKGLHYTQGRFFHILGNHDKGKSARLLIKFYKRVYGSVMTVGLGDSPNDLPLLEVVDLPVLIQKEDGGFEPGIDLPGLIKSEGIGPEGWNKAIMKILEVNRYG
ncbi:MAG: HAD-IIB family hydrolase [Thermodesulfobacteriota bacterium]